MNIEIFIAILGLLAAFYSIAPESLKARVNAFINPILFKISIPLYVILLLIAFYFDNHSNSPIVKESIFWLQYSLYLFLFIGCWYIYSNLTKRRLTKSNIVRYYKYLKVLLSRSEYSILIDILNGSLKDLLSFYNREIKRTTPKKPQLIIKIGAESITIPSAPTYSLEAEVSRKIFRDVIFNESFIKANIHYGKQFAINLIRGCRVNNIGLSDYTDLFMYELLKNKDSFLYSELKETHTVYSPSNDEFERYPFLQTLFEDIEYCDNQGFYRGIGEYVLEFVDRNIDNNNERYNRDTKYYWIQRERDEKYKCPIFMGLSFFEYMVNKAIRENRNSHMWLLYIHYWVEAICKKIKHYPEEWQGGKEFPTIYYYLLYELLHVHREWVDHIYKVSTEEQHGSSFQQFDKTIDISDARKLILEWILKDLLYCTDNIAQCKEIPYEKRVYLIETVMRINIGIKSNFANYGKAHIAIARNIESATDVYIKEFTERLKNRNYSRIFNDDLWNVCVDSLRQLDTIPLDSNAVKFWKEWLESFKTHEHNEV